MTATKDLASCALLVSLGLACSSTNSDPNVLPEGESTTGHVDGTEGDDTRVEETGTTTGIAERGGELPCDVATLLVEHCHACHDDPPRFGAPMPLVQLADVLAPLPSDRSRSVADAMHERIEDPVRPMPPTGMLEEEHRDVLARWIEAGSNGEDELCELPDPGDGPAIGPEALPCEVTHSYRAHGSNPEDGFHVPDVDDVYTCFNFTADFAEQSQAVAWAPIIDDDRVLHHFILYATSETLEPGAVGPCQIPEDAAYIAGWAPGRENVELPDDVGLVLPEAGGTIILEIHYNNIARHADARDRSGIAFCTVDEPRPNPAGFIRVGTFDIDIPAGAEGHEEVGMCPSWRTSDLPGPLNIISAFPHMHELGRSFRTEILRGGDEEAIEMLVDVPHFSFDYQVGYELEPFLQLVPGDELRTVCTYDNPTSSNVGYGPDTSDEMCFNRLLVYPLTGIPWSDCVY